MLIMTTQLRQVRQFFIGAFGKEADIHIQTTTVIGPMRYPWRNLSQGGEDKNWSPLPLVNGIRALSPEYIRIDHIYDFYDIVQKDGGRIRLSWSKLDELLRDIQKTGAKPYISLSYMPAEIAKNGDITGVPEDWNDWQFVVTKTIEHISGDLGIEDVYYEVWNEPDLFGGFKTYGEKNYLTLYERAALGAKSAQQTKKFYIGGPATTALYKNWIDALLTVSVEKNLPLDFLSWHLYSENIDDFRQNIVDIRNFLQNHPERKNVQLHITEWGPESANSTIYDTNVSAIHTIATSTELIGLIDRAFIFEIQDGKSPDGKLLWGRWGIFDSAGNPKPRYSALRFLDRLVGDRIPTLGKGTWVKGASTKEGQTIKTILANYDSANAHTETVPVTWEGITPGEYSLILQYFGGQTRSEKIATSSSKLLKNVPLGPNSAIYLELTKL